MKWNWNILGTVSNWESGLTHIVESSSGEEKMVGDGILTNLQLFPSQSAPYLSHEWHPSKQYSVGSIRGILCIHSKPAIGF